MDGSLEPWDEAREKCRENGGVLAMPQTAEDISFIRGIYSNDKRINALWLGARYQEDVWMWVDGKEMDRQMFEYGEPSGTNIKNCLAMSVKEKGAAGYKCASKKRFLCEYRAKKQCVIKN